MTFSCNLFLTIIKEHEKMFVCLFVCILFLRSITYYKRINQCRKNVDIHINTYAPCQCEQGKSLFLTKMDNKTYLYICICISVLINNLLQNKIHRKYVQKINILRFKKKRDAGDHHHQTDHKRFA